MTILSAKKSSPSFSLDFKSLSNTPLKSMKSTVATGKSHEEEFVHLGEHDVVCGKGRGLHEKRAGNEYYRSLINAKKDSYNDSSTIVRTTLIGEIRELIEERGGRFVQPGEGSRYLDPESGKYLVLGIDKVRKKISDDLRREIRRRRAKVAVNEVVAAKSPPKKTKQRGASSSSTKKVQGTKKAAKSLAKQDTKKKTAPTVAERRNPESLSSTKDGVRAADAAREAVAEVVEKSAVRGPPGAALHTVHSAPVGYRHQPPMTSFDLGLSNMLHRRRMEMGNRMMHSFRTQECANHMLAKSAPKSALWYELSEAAALETISRTLSSMKNQRVV